jgi:spore coat protein U-like protein
MRALILPGALLAALLVALAPTPTAAQIFDGRCNVHTQEFNFGVYSALDQAPTTTWAQIEVTCNRVEGVRTVQIALSPGSSGNALDRTMNRGGGHLLHYNIYMDPGHHRVVGDGTNGTVAPINLLLNGGRATFRFYGKIPPRQVVRDGNYDDRLRVTVEY